LKEILDIIEIRKNISVAATPTQVHISYLGQFSYLVQWVSASTDDPSQVMYGTSPTNISMSATGAAAAYSFEGYTSGGIHFATITGLNDTTNYYYQVGGPGQWSRTYYFTTAPPVGKQNLMFGLMGDVGADSFSEQTINGLIQIRSTSGLDAILHVGDLSYANNYNPGGPVWDHYGEILEPLASYTPYQPAVGNHETIDSFSAFKLRYGTEFLEKNSNGGDFFWSIDYGNVHIVFLSSETAFEDGSPQATWLATDLAAVNRQVTPWIIALWHRPWYCSNTDHDGEGEKMRLVIEPILNQYAVDICFTGHVHAYERVAEMYDFVPTPGSTNYFVLGNGGTPEGLAPDWEDPAPVWSEFRIAKWGYASLNVINQTHAFWTMYADSDGTVMDSAWVHKKFPRM